MDSGPLIAAVDVGKTSIKVGLFDPDLQLLHSDSFAASSEDRIIGRLLNNIGSLTISIDVGVSLFGPIETQVSADDYGAIVESSAPEWSGINLPRLLADSLGQDVYFAYDVNAGALAESTLISQGSKFVYLSVGTGIGGTPFQSGVSDPSVDPPQLGHMSIRRELGDSFPGTCRFHGDCLQGLASGRALAERWGMPASRIPADHEAWDLEARYLARACVNLLYTYSFVPILLGSSVSGVQGLRGKICSNATRMLNGFPATNTRRVGIENLIRLATFTPSSSLVGAGLLARSKCGLRMR